MGFFGAVCPPHLVLLQTTALLARGLLRVAPLATLAKLHQTPSGWLSDRFTKAVNGCCSKPAACWVRRESRVLRGGREGVAAQPLETGHPFRAHCRVPSAGEGGNGRPRYLNYLFLLGLSGAIVAWWS